MLWDLIRFRDFTQNVLLPLKFIFIACILLFSEFNTNNPYLYIVTYICI